MGNLFTRELKRDFIHLSEHTDFKTALRATGDLLDTFAKSEKLRFERKQQKMREREQAMQRGPGRHHNRQREEAGPWVMGSIDEGYGPTPRGQGRRNTRTERPPHCATFGKPRVCSVLTCLQRDNTGRCSVQSMRNMIHMLWTRTCVETAKIQTTCNPTAGDVTPTHINLGCILHQSIRMCQVLVITQARAIASEHRTRTCIMTTYEHEDLDPVHSDADQAGAILEYLR
ncbi:MAG: hypothetical protein Q9195_003678 [Heterodermia aff. obscurata]